MWNFLLTHTPLLYFTQSLWRDEVFSILYSSRPLPFILTKSSMEPPLYYLLLHAWMKLFGTSEIAARSLSFLGFALATVVVIEWSDKLFKKHWLSWFTPLLFFTNPMLLYYAFEVRTYGWYMFFATLSIAAYKEKKWLLYTIGLILGVYTHLYILVIPFTQFLHFLITNKTHKEFHSLPSFLSHPFIKSLLIFGICFIPWIYRLSFELGKMTNSWYYPVDLQLIKSVLGNLYTGYEGTPPFVWPYTALLSFVLFISFLYPVFRKKTQKEAVYFFLLIFVPLISVIGVSFIKPLFVNRYLIPVTLAEIFLLAYTIMAIPKKAFQYAAAVILFVSSILFTLWYAPYHTKTDFRKTLTDIMEIKQPVDAIYAEDAIIFLETLYYAKSTRDVRLYNPYEKPFPWYIGDAIFSPQYFISTLPTYPERAFLIKKNGSFVIGSVAPVKNK